MVRKIFAKLLRFFGKNKTIHLVLILICFSFIYFNFYSSIKLHQFRLGNYDLYFIQSLSSESLTSAPNNNTEFYRILKSKDYFYRGNGSLSRDNSECNIDLDEWDPKIKNLFGNLSVYSKCRANTPYSYVDSNNYLHLNQTVNELYYNSSIETCDVANVIRENVRSDGYLLEQFQTFESPYQLNYQDFIFVRCYTSKFSFVKALREKFENKKVRIKTQKGKYVVYEYVHAIFHDKKKYEVLNNNTKSRLNVMILVLDGVSLSSMKRALPETLKYLKSFEEFFLFEKHHVTGENTFENLVPMLTNMEPKYFLNRKWDIKKYKSGFNSKKIEPPFDEFPFIWKNFSKKGYLTYYSEEWKENTFHNLKFGFREKPTDYYLRPFWLSLYESLSYEKMGTNSNAKPCYYNKLLHKISFEWLENLEQFYSKKEKEIKNDANIIPRFGIVKINEMSHDYLERLFWIDNDLKGLLMRLFNIDNYLDNTLFILMGDHGHRFHKIRETFVGKMEEKLPMFSMMVPRKILKQNKFLKDLLLKNSKKLTTWWDVYETLLHILTDQLNMDPTNSEYLANLNGARKLENVPKGFSLFYPIPKRSCYEAHIPDYLCSCYLSLGTNINSTIIQESGKFMLDYINNNLLGNYSNGTCMKLSLKQIIDAQEITDKPNKYGIIFQTIPNSATFDATFIYNKPHDYNLLGNIIRINLYGSTANCMNDYRLKNFCYCPPSNKTTQKKQINLRKPKLIVVKKKDII